MASREEYLQKCPICLEVPRAPKIMPCQHIYCHDCINQLVTAGSGRPQCSLCRSTFSVLQTPALGCQLSTGVQQDFIINNYLSEVVPAHGEVLTSDNLPRFAFYFLFSFYFTSLIYFCRLKELFKISLISTVFISFIVLKKYSYCMLGLSIFLSIGHFLYVLEVII